jgi:hypothetical protein
MRMLEKGKEGSVVDREGKAHIWQEKLSEIKRKRADFQDLAYCNRTATGPERSRTEQDWSTG